MYLILNEVELNVNNAYTERDVNTDTLSAVIEIPYDAMDFTELKNLFMENTGVITKVNDDETTESWDGFKYDNPPVDDGNQYKIVLIGKEETYQIERTRHLEKTLGESNAKISTMESQISEKNATITANEATIEEQKETIATLEATVAEKNTEITAKDAEIAELLIIAEEYADILYAEAIEEMETVVDEPVIDESEVM